MSIDELDNSNIGIISNYLQDEGYTKAEITTLCRVITASAHKYAMFDNGILIGYYAYDERTPYTAFLSSLFLDKKYRSTKKFIELLYHMTNKLKYYKLVKSIPGKIPSRFADKFYDKTRKIVDIKGMHLVVSRMRNSEGK